MVPQLAALGNVIYVVVLISKSALCQGVLRQIENIQEIFFCPLVIQQIRLATDRGSLSVRNLPFLPCLTQLFVDHLLESLHGSVSEQLPVDENRGYAVYVGIDSIRSILLNFFHDFRIVHPLPEFLFVQAQLLYDFFDLLVVELIIILEEQIMEFPELPLNSRSHRRGSRFYGKDIALKGEMFKNQLYLLGILPEHLLE